MATPIDDRSRFAIASHWVSRILTAVLEMVLPGMAGYWVDKRVGTIPLIMTLGFGAGMTMAIWHLLQLTKRDARQGVTTEEARPQDHLGDRN